MREPKYYADNRLKPPKAFWEWCYRQMPSYIWKNKEKTIVASKRKHSYVIEKRLFKNSRLDFFDTKNNFMIVLCTSKRIEIQTYVVYSEFKRGIQQFETDLVNLEVLTGNQHIKLHYDNIDYEFVKGLKPVVGMFNYQYPEIYDDNIEERLSKVSELKYLNNHVRYSIDYLPRIYKYRERIEFAQKINADNLARDIATNNNIDMRVVNMKFIKENKDFFRDSRRSYNDYLLKKAIEARGVKMVLGIEEYLSEYEVKFIPKTTRLLKLQNYLIKQKRYFTYYQDYLNLLDDIRIPKDKQIKFPSDLVLSHDRAVDTLNAMQREIEMKEYGERYKKLKELEMTVGDFTFKFPQSAEEMIQEGSALKHCVSSSEYIKDHAKGETTIVFVRERTYPETPFLTMEYRDGRIIQLRGIKNASAPAKAREAADTWLKLVTKKPKKKAS